MIFNKDDAKNLVDQLDTLCWRCNGTGKHQEDADDCFVCDGSGAQLTDAGREMITFIARHRKRIEELK